MIYALGDTAPEIAEDVFIAPDAAVIGDVVIGSGSSVWFHCTIRGDVFPIRIGKSSNIQDNTVVHVTGGKFRTEIGDHVTIGHACIIHGATLRDHAFIGMGATVMDGADVSSWGLVAAGALVPPGFRVPEGVLVAGVPAKIIREIRPDEREMITEIPLRYSENGRRYARDLRKTG